MIVTVPEFLKARGITIYALCKATGIAYSTLHPHVKKGVPLSDRTARKLQEWSGEEMNAAEILGLSRPTGRITKKRAAPSRPKTRKAA